MRSYLIFSLQCAACAKDFSFPFVGRNFSRPGPVAPLRMCSLNSFANYSAAQPSPQFQLLSRFLMVSLHSTSPGKIITNSYQLSIIVELRHFFSTMLFFFVLRILQNIRLYTWQYVLGPVSCFYVCASLQNTCIPLVKLCSLR